MAIDHFVKHKYARERVDWNFNILFNDQPQVARLARQYQPLIKHQGLYSPVPTQWLHATVLRVGFLEEFSEAEMLAVADVLAPKLANMRLSELLLGQRWWLWNGGPVLGITPKHQLQEVFRQVLKALIIVVGRDRLPALTTDSASQPMKAFDYFLKASSVVVGRDRLPIKFQFIPHISLAYPKTYHSELELLRRLQSHPIDSVAIRAKSLSLIKQEVKDDYYMWEIVKDLPIGQDEISGRS
jgi:2'-5' RNA ligase